MQGSIFEAYAFAKTVMVLMSCCPPVIGDYKFAWFHVEELRKASQELVGSSCQALSSGNNRGNATAMASYMVLAAYSNGRRQMHFIASGAIPAALTGGLYHRQTRWLCFGLFSSSYCPADPTTSLLANIRPGQFTPAQGPAPLRQRSTRPKRDPGSGLRRWEVWAPRFQF